MSSIREYLLSISAAALMTGFAAALGFKGNTGKIINFVVTLLLVLVVVAPAAKVSVSDLAQAITSFRMNVEQMETGVEIKNREILGELIKEQCETYISDKADDLGITLQAEIILSKEGEYPYPVHVRLVGKLSDEDRAYLQRIIEENMGIPIQEQEWE